jgi:hypothetical protein
MRRWTLIALTALVVLLVAVALYQLRLADRRSDLEERRSPPAGGP